MFHLWNNIINRKKWLGYGFSCISHVAEIIVARKDRKKHYLCFSKFLICLTRMRIFENLTNLIDKHNEKFKRGESLYAMELNPYSAAVKI